MARVSFGFPLKPTTKGVPSKQIGTAEVLRHVTNIATWRLFWASNPPEIPIHRESPPPPPRRKNKKKKQKSERGVGQIGTLRQGLTVQAARQIGEVLLEGVRSLALGHGKPTWRNCLIGQRPQVGLGLSQSRGTPKSKW